MMYNTTDIGNIAFYCLVIFGVLGIIGLPGVIPMLLALGGIILVSAMLMK